MSCTGLVRSRNVISEYCVVLLSFVVVVGFSLSAWFLESVERLERGFNGYHLLF